MTTESEGRGETSDDRVGVLAGARGSALSMQVSPESLSKKRPREVSHGEKPTQQTRVRREAVLKDAEMQLRKNAFQASNQKLRKSDKVRKQRATGVTVKSCSLRSRTYFYFPFALSSLFKSRALPKMAARSSS